MSGVEHVYSVSRPGMAIITVQFDVGVKYHDAVVRLYDTVHSHRDWLSPNLGVLEPIDQAERHRRRADRLVDLLDHRSDRSAFDLQQVARAVEIELKRIKGTRDMYDPRRPRSRHSRADGQRADERLRRHAAGYRRRRCKVGNALQSSGNLIAGNRDVLVQTGTYLESAADVRQLVVAVRGNANERKPVFMSDVARVEDGPDQPKAYAWFGNKEGEFPAVTLQMSKKPGVNAADVANAVIERIESLKNTVIPEGVEVTVTRNYGETATDKAQKLIGKLIFATAFVVLLVFFALGRREALIVGVAVTLTLAATLFASWAWGFTLNRVSLFALIFSIGILVDDAIVVVENIHRWQALHPEQAAARNHSAGRRRSRRADHPRHLHRDRRAAADGLRHRPDGAVHEPDPDQLVDGHGHFAGRRLRRDAVAGGTSAEKHGDTHRARSQRAPKLDAPTGQHFPRLLTPFLDPLTGGAARLKLLLGRRRC